MKTELAIAAPFSLLMGFLITSTCSEPSPVSATAGVDPCALTKPVSWKGSAVKPVAIKGLYSADCIRQRGEVWTLQLDGAPGSLEVTSGESLASCTLLLTTVQLTSSEGGARTDFELAPPIALSLSHAVSASAVNQPGPNGTQAFYANARLLRLPDPVYTSPFLVELVYGAEPYTCAGLNLPPAWYTRYSVSAASTPVAAPNYEIDASGVLSVVDANNVVQGASSGDVVLWLPTSRPQPGQELKILPADARPDSFEQIDAAYRAAPGVIPIAGQKRVSLAFAKLSLFGHTLPQTRTVLVKRTDEASGVPAYEVLRILFPAP